ncbi:MAG: hypothetical protein JOY67_04105 [Hyphomicrobiales bacterium]|nr:hypothetical protein [Hyphomicrobiales bacterium]
MTKRRLHFVVRARGARIHASLQSHEESVHDRADPGHDERRLLHFVMRALGARIHASPQSHEEGMDDRADARS